MRKELEESVAAVEADPQEETVVDGADEIAELVQRAAGGDKRAWEALVDRFGGLIWAIARNFRLSDTDCGDVSQSTWLRLVENIDRLNDPARVGSWLATTARRECLRTIARRDKWVLTGDTEQFDAVTDGSQAVDHALLVAETVETVRQAVQTLPDQWRTLINMLMLDPVPSYDEISRALGMPIGSIGPTRGRSLQRLRAAIEG